MSPPDSSSFESSQAGMSFSDETSRQRIEELTAEIERLQDLLGKRTHDLEQAQAQLYLAREELREAALGGVRTGIASDPRFMETLDLEWRRAIRSEEAISLLVLEIDHTDGVCFLDEIGEVLKYSANRPGDMVGHYQVDLFGVLLPGTGAEGAAVVAERIRLGVSGLGLSHEVAGEPMRVTVSIGSATVLDTSCQPPQTIEDMAGKALAEATRSGRDRVVAWSPELSK